VETSAQSAEAPTKPTGETVGVTYCTRRDLKDGKDIESLPSLALFVFCSGAVPSYSSHSQNTKFISLSQNLPACRNL